jgi:hypothetical protein
MFVITVKKRKRALPSYAVKRMVGAIHNMSGACSPTESEEYTRPRACWSE